LDKSLAKSPDDRFVSADVFREALKASVPRQPLEPHAAAGQNPTVPDANTVTRGGDFQPQPVDNPPNRRLSSDGPEGTTNDPEAYQPDANQVVVAGGGTISAEAEWRKRDTDDDRPKPSRRPRSIFLIGGLLAVVLAAGIGIAIAGNGSHTKHPTSVSTPSRSTATTANPDDPTGLSVRFASNGTVATVKWTDHTDGKAAYELIVKWPGSASSITEQVMTPPYSYTLPRLSPARKYCFIVLAVLQTPGQPPLASTCPRGGEVNISPGAFGS
jgi:hypothetical protein